MPPSDPGAYFRNRRHWLCAGVCGVGAVVVPPTVEAGGDFVTVIVVVEAGEVVVAGFAAALATVKVSGLPSLPVTSNGM